MTEEIRYIANLQRQEEFDNEVTELKDELKRLEQENKELKEKVKSLESEIRQKKMTIMMNNDHYLTVDENNRKYRSALEEIRELAEKSIKISYNLEVNSMLYDITDKINKVLNHSES